MQVELLALRSGKSDTTGRIYPLSVVEKICSDINSPDRIVYVTDTPPEMNYRLELDMRAIAGRVDSAEIVYGNLFIKVTQISSGRLNVDQISDIAVAGVATLGPNQVVGDDFKLLQFYVTNLKIQ